jgi:diadenosine tetraphosphate (Ap4A) HIT family hydrolase
VRGPVIDAHRYTADVAIHVHIIVAHHGQSFKTPPAYQTVHAKRPPRQRLRCVLGMLNSLEVKVLPQPDGGEG